MIDTILVLLESFRISFHARPFGHDVPFEVEDIQQTPATRPNSSTHVPAYAFGKGAWPHLYIR